MGNTPSAPQTQTTKQATNNNYQLLKKLDDPHYGEIKLVRDTKTGQQIFMKEILFRNKDVYQTEVIFYNKRVAVSHPNVVRILGCTGSDQQNFFSGYFKLSVFIEVLPKTLAEEIGVRLQTGIPFSENDILFVAENLIAGLSYFETQNIFHGDIRPDNIFATAHAYKLTDPYLNVQKNANALSHAILGTARTFVSPQLLIQVPQQDFNIECNKFKADVFSLGLVLLSMASLTSSEDLYDYDRGLMDLDQLRERLEIVRKSYSKFTYELIRNMLKIREEKRPDFFTLANKLLPYQEDIRRKVEMTFFGVRAPAQEIDNEGEEFFAKAYGSLQEEEEEHNFQVPIHQGQLMKPQKGQPFERKMNQQDDNIKEIQGYDERSPIVSVHSSRLIERQPQTQRKAHGQIFEKVQRSASRHDENIDMMSSRSNPKELLRLNQSQKQNYHQGQMQTPRQQTERQEEQRPQLHAQQVQALKQQQQQQQQYMLQQQELHQQRQKQIHEEEQMSMQYQQQQQQQMQQQKQKQLEEDKREHHMHEQVQPKHHQQQQQRQKQFEEEQMQLRVQLQQEQQMQKELQYQMQSQQQQQYYQKNQAQLQASPGIQRSALSTRQINIDQQTLLNPQSPYEKQSQNISHMQVPNRIKPSYSPSQVQYKNVLQSENLQHHETRNQNTTLDKAPVAQLNTQAKAEPKQIQPQHDLVLDDLEARVRAAIQRSENTYQMASKNHAGNIQAAAVSNENENNELNFLTETSSIPSIQHYKSTNYGLYEAPLANMSDFGRISPSEKAGDLEDIINTLNLSKVGQNVSSYPKDIETSVPLTVNFQHPSNQSQTSTGYLGRQPHTNYGGGINPHEESDFIKYDTVISDVDYGYNYGKTEDVFISRKQGLTVRLNE